MKRFLLILTLLGSGAAQAAAVTVPVEGLWTVLRNWTPAQLGEPAVQSTAGGGPELELSGTMTYDDVSGAVLALDIVGATKSMVWEAGFDPVTLAGYSWTSSGTDLLLNPGAVISCNGIPGGSADCGAGYQFGQGLFNTLVSFDGVIPGGVMPGPDGGEFISERPGFSGTVVGNQVTIDLWKGFDPFVPIAANAEFELSIVPVPAAVWLFGSALGALGWARRRRVTS